MPPSRRTRSQVSSTPVVDPRTTQDVITDNMADAPTNPTHAHPQPVENLKSAAPIEAAADLTAVTHEQLDPTPATSDPRPTAIPTLEILAEPASLETGVSTPAVAHKGLDPSPTSPKSIDTTSTPAHIEPTITNVDPRPADSELVDTAHPSSSADESQTTRAIDEDRLRFLERKLNETKDLLRPEILALKKKLKIVNPIIDLTAEEGEPERVSRSRREVLDMQDSYMCLAKREIKSLDKQVRQRLHHVDTPNTEERDRKRGFEAFKSSESDAVAETLRVLKRMRTTTIEYRDQISRTELCRSAV